MLKTQIPDSGIHVFWAENSSEDTTIVRIDERGVEIYQYDHWVIINKNTLQEILKLINGTKG